MLRGLTALVGLATTTCVGVFGFVFVFGVFGVLCGTLLVMLRGLTALVGLATTACVGVFGVDAILAVTAATITSLFFCPPPDLDWIVCALPSVFVCLLFFALPSGRGLVFG